MSSLTSNAAYRQALHKVLGHPEWLTFAAFILLISLFTSGIALSLNGVIPIWLGMFSSFISIHAGFTVMHEASHRTISGGDRKRAWMDRIPGTIHATISLYDYPIFRDLHMNHHNRTGDEEADPDSWLQRHNTLSVIVLSPFVALHYLRLYVLLARDQDKLTSPGFWLSMLRVTALVTLIFALLWRSPINTFVLWILPAAAASTLLSLSHRILHIEEEAAATGSKPRIIIGSGFWEWIICPFFWLNNHHALHHENPRLPVGKHAAFFKQFEDDFRADGTQIITLGKTPQTSPKTTP